MDSGSAAAAHVFRPQLLERRARLQAASSSVSPDYLNGLIAEIDEALERIDGGSYGLCETCHEAIEADRLQEDPLVRFCLDHLNELERRAHQQDLDLATQIQFRLLPPSDIALERWDAHYAYQPAAAVGGDYCELTEAGDGAVFFAVGDVAGKGVAASLLMTHLSAIFRSLLSLELPLAEMVSRANRLFCASVAPPQYATLACGRTTPGGVEICNAGHCAPVLIRGKATERLESNGLPLGIFRTGEYETTRVPMAAGDSIALFSDGISEAQDADGREYSEDRLVALLEKNRTQPAKRISGAVLQDIARFRGARTPNDDVTLLILRRRD